MNETSMPMTGALVLLSTLTSVLVANGVITKLDLLSELERQNSRFPVPPDVLLQLRALVHHILDR